VRAAWLVWLGGKKMKRLVIFMIVSAVATVVAHATECSVATFPAVVTIVQTPPTAVTIMSAGATGSSGAISATLKPAASKGVNLIGFEVTSQQSGLTLTITGLAGGTITYMVPNTQTNPPNYFAINFPCPLTGVVNTNVVATLTGVISATALVIHGF
jgi:hypothetical protein